uniref:Uncharacterized protein n=1 Tax=Tanacetum cinerariifolium TaxID=118510 RepID=A0A6L2NVG5_TANCI|nr:hypothetical protein [Tanacetum cinerariifolium]
MVNPTIYVSCIKQFWATASNKKANDVVKLQAIIDGKRVVVFEDFIQLDLRLDDADGVECLPNEDIFTKLARMGYEKPPPTITFYKAFFSAQWKFLIHTLVENSTSLIKDLSSHTNQYTSLALTQKVFANMCRGGGCIQTRGRIEAMDADKDITLVDAKTQVNLGAELQGRKDDNNAAIKDASAAKPTVFDDEEITMTMAQTLIKMKAKKGRLLDEQMAKRLHDEERKPVSIAQARKNMIIYLKNMAGYKMEYFIGEFKKLKAVEVLGSHSTQDTPTNDLKEISEEDVKNMLEIVPVSEFKVKALQVNAKLQVEEDSEMARNLVMKIFMKANKPKSKNTMHLFIKDREYEVFIGKIPSVNRLKTFKLAFYGHDWWTMMDELAIPTSHVYQKALSTGMNCTEMLQRLSGFWRGHGFGFILARIQVCRMESYALKFADDVHLGIFTSRLYSIAAKQPKLGYRPSCRMFGSKFITIVELGAKLVNGMNLPLQLEKRVYPPSGSQTVDLVLNHMKYKVLVGNVSLENYQNIFKMYLYRDEWWKMMKELDFQPGHLFAFNLLCRGLFHFMIFNESG